MVAVADLLDIWPRCALVRFKYILYLLLLFIFIIEGCHARGENLYSESARRHRAAQQFLFISILNQHCFKRI